MKWKQLGEWIASMTPEQAATDVKIICDAYKGHQDREMLFIDVSLLRHKKPFPIGPLEAPHIIVGE